MPPGAFYCILKANDPEIHYHNTLYLTYVRLHTAYEYTFKMPNVISNLRLRKVDLVLAVGNWVGFGPAVGSKKNHEKN